MMEAKNCHAPGCPKTPTGYMSWNDTLPCCDEHKYWSPELPIGVKIGNAILAVVMVMIAIFTGIAVIGLLFG